MAEFFMMPERPASERPADAGFAASLAAACRQIPADSAYADIEHSLARLIFAAILSAHARDRDSEDEWGTYRGTMFHFADLTWLERGMLAAAREVLPHLEALFGAPGAAPAAAGNDAGAPVHPLDGLPE